MREHKKGLQRFPEGIKPVYLIHVILSEHYKLDLCGSAQRNVGNFSLKSTWNGNLPYLSKCILMFLMVLIKNVIICHISVKWQTLLRLLQSFSPTKPPKFLQLTASSHSDLAPIRSATPINIYGFHHNLFFPFMIIAALYKNVGSCLISVKCKVKWAMFWWLFYVIRSRPWSIQFVIESFRLVLWTGSWMISSWIR